MGRDKQYTDEFKQDVLAMAAEGTRTITQIEHDLGLPPGLISKWQQRHRTQEQRPGSGARIPASSHPPLNPRAYAVSQYGAAAAIVVLIVSAPLQVGIALAAPGAGMFVVTAILSLLLTLPLFLLLRATPPVVTDDTGITLSPRVGKTLRVAWDDVHDVKPYSLLPPPDSETVRRAAVGRKKYRAAEGLMLCCAGLPWPYRIVGWFAGEGFRGVFAVTNRSHAGYDALKARNEKRSRPPA